MRQVPITLGPSQRNLDCNLSVPPLHPQEKQNLARLCLALSNVSGLGSLTYVADENTVTNLKYLLNLSLCP